MKAWILHLLTPCYTMTRLFPLVHWWRVSMLKTSFILWQRIFLLIFSGWFVRKEVNGRTTALLLHATSRICLKYFKHSCVVLQAFRWIPIGATGQVTNQVVHSLANQVVHSHANQVVHSLANQVVHSLANQVVHSLANQVVYSLANHPRKVCKYTGHWLIDLYK